MPQWWAINIEDDKLHFLMWDLSQFARISLLPLVAFLLAKDKGWKVLFLAYFFLTLTNLVGVVFEFYEIAESWMTTVKVAGALIIIGYSSTIIFRDYKWNGIK